MITIFYLWQVYSLFFNSFREDNYYFDKNYIIAKKNKKKIFCYWKLYHFKIFSHFAHCTTFVWLILRKKIVIYFHNIILYNFKFYNRKIDYYNTKKWLYDTIYKFCYIHLFRIHQTSWHSLRLERRKCIGSAKSMSPRR